MVPKILYARTEDAWNGFEPFLVNLINSTLAKKVCDIGAGANPVIARDYIDNMDLDYYLMDISEDELLKAPRNYNTILADIAAKDFAIDQKFDFVFSKMLAEHIADAEQFHKNVLNCLSDSGMAVHFFPTLYTLPFVVNYLTPEYFSKNLLHALSPRDSYKHAKFPAYYQWCRGPTRSQIQKFVSLGYDVVEYKGFFGHSRYYNRMKLMRKLHNWKTSYLLRHPNPLFTSYAYVVLRKA